MASAGLVRTSLIWIAYAIAVLLALLVAVVTTFTWQTPRDRSAVVSVVSIFSLTALLATVLLLPVDIALVSSTASTALGAKKDWATDDQVARILLTLKVVYYCLYSLDALLCLLVIPFSYFWYEEYDEVEEEEGTKSWASRFWGALKYTVIFFLLVVVLLLLGFFVPAAGRHGGGHLDLDYFRRLLAENKGEKALTFAVGLLMTLGALLYALYTGAGLALLPVSLVKSAPSVSAPQLYATTASALEQNRERQRQLELRNAGRPTGSMPQKDRRELDALMREERTLVRRERVAADARGEGRSFVVRAWSRIQAFFRPLKLVGGVLLLLIAVLVWVSVLITGIDKAANSVCKQRCGYILGHVNVFQPINWIFLRAAHAFPVDYVLMALLVLLLFSSSISGVAAVGIRFLWVRVFQIKKGRTPPQALLIATVMLALIILGVNYSAAMMVAPQYAIYGTQTFCLGQPRYPGGRPDCHGRPELVVPCSEALQHKDAGDVCTPSVMSTLLNRVTLNWPVFGDVAFWAQFAFLAVFLVVFVTCLIRTPRLNVSELDEEAEVDEEEGLLASTGRRFGATWQDLTGRARGRGSAGGADGRTYGTHDDGPDAGS